MGRRSQKSRKCLKTSSVGGIVGPEKFVFSTRIIASLVMGVYRVCGMSAVALLGVFSRLICLLWHSVVLGSC